MCLIQYLLDKQFFVPLANAYTLYVLDYYKFVDDFPVVSFGSAKCIEQKMWENSPFLVRQVDKIGAKYASALVEAGMRNYPCLFDLPLFRFLLFVCLFFFLL
jgi:hypothetical protein